MNKTVVMLSLSTAVFAGSTAYLAADKYLGGARPDESPSLAAGAETGVSPRLQEVAAQAATADYPGVPATAATPASVSTQPDGAPASPDVAARPDAQAEGGRQFARQFLARYDDPVQRAAMLDEAKAGVRRQYGRLKEQLKLSDATFEQVVTLLADETLLLQEHFSRCAVDPRCDAGNPSRQAPYNAHSEEFLALLGADHIEAFTQFRGSIGERDAVIQLRGRLPDSNFLPESKAELLITALADERERYQREASAQGAKVGGWGTQQGMLMYIQDSGSVDQYIIEATKYSQRLRSRAAGVLSPAQLAAYVQMQDELLAQMGAYLRPAPAPRKASSATLRSS